jgi:hypothetical protein
MWATDWAFKQGLMRYWGIGMAALVIVFIPPLVVEQYNALCRTDVSVRPKKIARERLIAEICAGLTLAAFCLVFSRTGFDLDRQNGQARFGHLNKATKIVEVALTAQACQRGPAIATTCKEIRATTNDLFLAIVNNDEQNIQGRSEYLESKLRFAIALQAPQVLTDALREIGLVKIDPKEGMLATILIQGILLLAGAAAVSRKISLAAFDPNIRPQTPITWSTFQRLLSISPRVA